MQKELTFSAKFKSLMLAVFLASCSTKDTAPVAHRITDYPDGVDLHSEGEVIPVDTLVLSNRISGINARAFAPTS